MGLDDLTNSLQRAMLGRTTPPSRQGATDRGSGTTLMNAGMKYVSSQGKPKPTTGGMSGHDSGGYSGSGGGC